MTKPVLFNLKADQGESRDVAGRNPEVVKKMAALADAMREELGEYGRRGDGQRATGSAVPDAPVISHMKDWSGVPEAVREKVDRVRAERHPGRKEPAGKRRRRR
jgi:hypothetical protein